MYRKYYSYSDMPQLIRRQETEEERVHNEKKQEQKCMQQTQESGKLFGKFEIDDVILAVIILSLLLDDGDDSLLLIALAFVFLTGLL